MDRAAFHLASLVDVYRRSRIVEVYFNAKGTRRSDLRDFLNPDVLGCSTRDNRISLFFIKPTIPRFCDSCDHSRIAETERSKTLPSAEGRIPTKNGNFSRSSGFLLSLVALSHAGFWHGHARSPFRQRSSN